MTGEKDLKVIYDSEEFKAWVVPANKTAPFLALLVENKFTMTPSEEGYPEGTQTICFMHPKGDFITIEMSKNGKERIITCNNLCIPIIDIAFRGTEGFRPATEYDY